MDNWLKSIRKDCTCKFHRSITGHVSQAIDPECPQHGENKFLSLMESYGSLIMYFITLMLALYWISKWM